MIDDRSREFMNVRKIAKEYENVTRHLDRTSPCFPPQGTADEIKQKSYWLKYIEWEKGNPIKTEDTTFVSKRGSILMPFLFSLRKKAVCFFLVIF